MQDKDASHAGGNEITQEQVRDVYTAGTSDGVIILGGGETRVMKNDKPVQKANQGVKSDSVTDLEYYL